MSACASQYAICAKHRLVVNDYGTDVVLRDEASGLKINLRSQFLGGLTEAFINERLGKCHLSLAMIIYFFDKMSYEPGRVGPPETRVVSWIGFALVADLLDLPHVLPSSSPDLADESGVVTSELLSSLLRCKARHRSNVVDDVVFFVCAVVGHRGDKVNVAKCAALVRKEYDDRPNLLFEYAFLLGGGSTTIRHSESLNGKDNAGDMKYDLRSMRVIDASYVQNYLQTLQTMVSDRPPHVYDCVAAYTCARNTKYEDLPFEICQSPDDSMFDLVAKQADTTIDSIFETPIRKNDIVIVPFTRHNIHVLQAVLVHSCQDGVLTARPFLSALGGNPPLVNDFFKIHTGKNAGIRTVTSIFTDAYVPDLFVFGLDRFVDPFVASADFTIEIGNRNAHSLKATKWKVHDWVLYERWSFFKRVMDAGLAETRDKIITLPAEFPVPLLYMVLSYVYTSSFEVDGELVDQVRQFVLDNVDFYDFGTKNEAGMVVANPGWYDFLRPFYKGWTKLK